MKTHIKVAEYRDPTAASGANVDALGWVSRVEMLPFAPNLEGSVGIGKAVVQFWRDVQAAYDPTAVPIGKAEYTTGVGGFPSLPKLMEDPKFMQGVALINEVLLETVAGLVPGATAEE